MEAAFGFPHYQMHRADLLHALACALPAERLHTGHRFTALVDHGDHVEATFENGAHISVDVLVGADGIHSAVRRVLFGDESPRFAGCIAYRGLVPADRLAHLELAVTVPALDGTRQTLRPLLRAESASRQFCRSIEQDTWTSESWTDRVTWPTRSPRTKSGTPWSGISSGRSTKPSYGHSSTARR